MKKLNKKMHKLITNYGCSVDIQDLIKEGANPNKVLDGITPLQRECTVLAEGKPSLSTLRTLLKAGADPNKKVSGLTPLEIVCGNARYNLEEIEELLQYGAKATKDSLDLAKKSGANERVLRCIKAVLDGGSPLKQGKPLADCKKCNGEGYVNERCDCYGEGNCSACGGGGEQLFSCECTGYCGRI